MMTGLPVTRQTKHENKVKALYTLQSGTHLWNAELRIDVPGWITGWLFMLCSSINCH